MIQPGETFAVDAGLTGQGRNTTGDVPCRLRFRLPCCRGEKRPAYDDVHYFVSRGTTYPVRCNGCGWTWKITAMREGLAGTVSLTLRA